MFEAEPYLASGSFFQLAATCPFKDTFFIFKPGETSRNQPARAHRPGNPVGLFGLRYARIRSLRSARFWPAHAGQNLAYRRPLREISPGKRTTKRIRHMGCAVRFGSSGFGTKKVNGIRQKKKLFSILIDSLRFHSLRALLFSAFGGFGFV